MYSGARASGARPQTITAPCTHGRPNPAADLQQGGQQTKENGCVTQDPSSRSAHFHLPNMGIGWECAWECPGKMGIGLALRRPALGRAFNSLGHRVWPSRPHAPGVRLRGAGVILTPVGSVMVLVKTPDSAAILPDATPSARDKDGRPSRRDRIIEIAGLHKRYGTIEVLKGCDLLVDRGELVVICGPSGSGKSTFDEMPQRPGAV